MAAIPSRTKPATRLHAVLTQAAGQRGSNNPAYQVWAQIFDVTPDPPDQVLIRCGQLVSLVGEVSTLGQTLPASETPEMVMRHFHEVDQVARNMGVVGNTPFSQFLQPLTDTGILSVEMVGAALKRQGYREADVSTDDRTRLLAEIASLKEQVTSSDELDEETRHRILLALEQAEVALRESLLRGGDGLQAASDGLIGLVVNLPRRAWTSPVVRKLAKCAAAMASAIIIATATDVATHAIEGGSAPASTPGVEVVLMISDGRDVPASLHDGRNVPIEVDGEVVEAEVVQEGGDALPPDH